MQCLRVEVEAFELDSEQFREGSDAKTLLGVLIAAALLALILVVAVEFFRLDERRECLFLWKI
jgi:hypothetical protein